MVRFNKFLRAKEMSYSLALLTKMAAEHTSCTIPDFKAGVFTLKDIE